MFPVGLCVSVSSSPQFCQVARGQKHKVILSVCVAESTTHRAVTLWSLKKLLLLNVTPQGTDTLELPQTASLNTSYQWPLTPDIIC